MTGSAAGRWAEIGALGEYFTVSEHGRSEHGTSERWRPLAELVTDPAVLTGRVTVVREALAASYRRPIDQVPWRVAGSIFQLGLFARLISPQFALALLHGELLPVGLADLRWRPTTGTGYALSVPAGCREPGPANRSALAARFAAVVVAGQLAELVAAISAGCALSATIGWDNAASAVNGTAIVLGGQLPSRLIAIAALAGAVLASPPLTVADPLIGAGFRRRSCCLLYRISPAGRATVCGDCVLRTG